VLSAARMNEIRALLAAQVEAWNRGDLAAFVDRYTDDATYIGSDGLTRGRTAIAERYARRPEMGHLELSIVELIVGADIAHALVRWSVDGAGGYALLAFARTDAGWRIQFDATT
jgi:ketosteroid isomerase-like protein